MDHLQRIGSKTFDGQRDNFMFINVSHNGGERGMAAIEDRAFHSMRKLQYPLILYRNKLKEIGKEVFHGDT